MVTGVKGAIAAALTAAALLVGTLPAVASDPGAQTSGDSLFPDMGNGGYQVLNYSVKIDYAPTTGAIDAVTRVRLTASQDLSNFSLDLSGLTVDQVLVDGVSATFTRSGHKLIVTPASVIGSGATSQVEVAYHGIPEPWVDLDGSSDGWQKVAHGVIALNEPHGAMTWFPVNNRIDDKATFDLEVSAPTSITVASCGTFAGRTVAGATATTRWKQTTPIAPYLTSVTLMPLKLVKGWAGSVPTRSYLDSGSNAVLPRWAGSAITFFSGRVGPYPFASGGITAVVGVPYALEVASRPVVSAHDSRSTVVHEIAHQWFGDSVTPADWGDIWLNEGFATYSEWQWRTSTNPGWDDRRFAQLYAKDASDGFWAKAPAALPSGADLFDTDAVYQRGAMTLVALRHRIGKPAMRTLLRRWYSSHKGQTVSTADFVALAQQVSGQDLHSFFDQWLYQPAKPASGH
mgnify:CR=1 FL=1